MNREDARDTRVKLHDGDDEKAPVVWSGKLVDFLATNDLLSGAEMTAIVNAILTEGRYLGGGGAAPAYLLVIDRS